MAKKTIETMVATRTATNNTNINKEDMTMMTAMDKMVAMKEMVVAEINKMDSCKVTDSNEEILDLGLALATMDWSRNALEWLARTWGNFDDDDYLDTVAGQLMSWQNGYRCEQTNVPSVLLMWAATSGETGWDGDSAIEYANRVVRARIQPMVYKVKEDLLNGIVSHKAWQAAIEDGCECGNNDDEDDYRPWTEYEIQLAEDIVKAEYENQLLLTILKDHTIKNAREVLHGMWKDDYEYFKEDGIYDALSAAIERCENGGMDADDWNLLVEQTEC